MDHLRKVKDYLDEEKIDYEVLHHEPAYTALETAQASHVPGKQMVKSVLVKTDSGFAMCVLPAIHNIDWERLCAGLGTENADLATEEEVGQLFPECELGAEPPFGNWHDIPTFVDQLLEEDKHIVFNAGTHTDLVKILYADFKRLTNPTVLPMGIHV